MPGRVIATGGGPDPLETRLVVISELLERAVEELNRVVVQVRRERDCDHQEDQ